MQEEKQYMTILISQCPKTQILLDKRLPEIEKQKRISRYLTKDGKLKIDTVKDHTVYGIK